MLKEAAAEADITENGPYKKITTIQNEWIGFYPMIGKETVIIILQ